MTLFQIREKRPFVRLLPEKKRSVTDKVDVPVQGTEGTGDIGEAEGKNAYVPFAVLLLDK